LVNRIAALMRDGGRLINLSSLGHRYSNVDLEDPTLNGLRMSLSLPMEDLKRRTFSLLLPSTDAIVIAVYVLLPCIRE